MGQNAKYDITVLKLKNPVNYHNSPNINSVCLPSQGADFTGKRCWVSGWGKNAFGYSGQYSNILKEVDVPILSPYDCESRLRATRLGHKYNFDEYSFVCAGGESGKDSCEGDGGSPLVCEQNGVWYLAGLVAWGIGCANPNIPGVYVNIPSFSDWIVQNSIGQQYGQQGQQYGGQQGQQQ